MAPSSTNASSSRFTAEVSQRVEASYNTSPPKVSNRRTRLPGARRGNRTIVDSRGLGSDPVATDTHTHDIHCDDEQPQLQPAYPAQGDQVVDAKASTEEGREQRSNQRNEDQRPNKKNEDIYREKRCIAWDEFTELMPKIREVLGASTKRRWTQTEDLQYGTKALKEYLDIKTKFQEQEQKLEDQKQEIKKKSQELEQRDQEIERLQRSLRKEQEFREMLIANTQYVGQQTILHPQQLVFRSFSDTPTPGLRVEEIIDITRFGIGTPLSSLAEPQDEYMMSIDHHFD